jgi:hypothetical protein
LWCCSFLCVQIVPGFQPSQGKEKVLTLLQSFRIMYLYFGDPCLAAACVYVHALLPIEAGLLFLKLLLGRWIGLTIQLLFC